MTATMRHSKGCTADSALSTTRPQFVLNWAALFLPWLSPTAIAMAALCCHPLYCRLLACTAAGQHVPRIRPLFQQSGFENLALFRWQVWVETDLLWSCMCVLMYSLVSTGAYKHNVCGISSKNILSVMRDCKVPVYLLQALSRRCGPRRRCL